MKSKNKSLFSRFLALMLAFVMTFTMMPATASAAGQSSSREGTGGGTEDPMHYEKTTTLGDDGTYTIRMETYATGTVTTSTNQKPTDIVLVLDVSGSMEEDDFPAGENYVKFSGSNSQAYNNRNNLYVLLDDGKTYAKVTVTRSGRFGNRVYTYHAEGMSDAQSSGSYEEVPKPYNGRLYTLSSQNIARIDALQDAANAFVDATAAKNAEIADPNMQHKISIVKFAGWKNDSIGNNMYRDGGYTYNYSQIVQGLTTVDSSAASSMKNTINNLQAAGATSADYGLQHASTVLGMSNGQIPDDGRNKVVIMFTDGEPNHERDFDDNVAAAAVNEAKDLKDAGVTVYTISVMEGSDPDDTSSDMNSYMNAVSSNYPDAEAGNDWWGNASWDYLTLGTGSNQGYYKVATNASELTDIFKEISNSVGSAAVDLTKESVVRDVLADGFAFPASWSIDTIKEHVSVATADYLGNGNFGEEKAFNEAVININDAKDTIDVSGFDYAANYVVDASADGDVKLNGKKLIITITGIEATDAAVTNAAVPTNKETSGIYEKADSEEAFRTFEVPTTMLTSKSYVLDFAKKVDLTSTDWRQNTVTTLDGDGMNAFASSENSLKETYGNVAQNGNTLAYEPKTTNWDGYDSFYVFGKTSDKDILAASANANGNVWSKVNVIPATSVYYEDDFGYTSEDRDATDIAEGYTTIKYDGNWSIDKEGQASGDTQSSENIVYGTDTSYDNNYGYSDGSATGASKAGAKATFTFTGTGLDIYTSTNSKSGLVLAQIKGQTHGKIYTAIIDNEFKSNGETGLYQIPTISFQNVVRDTYDVTLTVGSDTDGNSTYYLDAIRVYNPIEETDSTVSDAYEEAGEANSKTVELRKKLLDAEDLGTVDGMTEGVAYIDIPTDGDSDHSTADIAEYEERGPKNEVYIEPGKGIAFALAEATYEKVFLGIKAPEGQSSVDITAGNEELLDKAITSATDMYYEITPTDEGYVVIKNTGDNLISITKLRVTGVANTDTQDIELQVTPELMSYAASFSSLPYVDEVEEPDENTGDVDIENPEVPENPSDAEDGKTTIKDVIDSLWDSIWDGFSSWFSRW